MSAPPAAQVVRCPQCDNVLGQVIAGCWVIRHRGREWIGAQLMAVKCEVCARTWSAADLTGRSDVTAA